MVVCRGWLLYAVVWLAVAGCRTGLENILVLEGDSGTDSGNTGSRDGSLSLDGAVASDGGFADSAIPRSDASTSLSREQVESFRQAHGQLWYRFDEGSGAVVTNHGALGADYDLDGFDETKVTWVADGLRIDAQTRLFAAGLASTGALRSAVAAGNAISIEVWFTPQNIAQRGPARIFAWSQDSREQTILVGQTEDDVTVRWFKRNAVGSIIDVTPAATDPLIAGGRSQAVFVVDLATQNALVFLDGALLTLLNCSTCSTDHLDSGHRISVANEGDNDRGWLGTMHQVVVYNRVLDADFVASSFELGPN